MSSLEQFRALMQFIKDNKYQEASELLKQSHNSEELIEYDQEERTVHPLYLAAKLGRDSLVRLLLENQGDPYVRHEKKGLAPIHVAVLKNHLDVVKELLNHDEHMIELETDTSGRDPLCTPLHFAVEVDDSQIKVLELLLARGADYNCRDMHNKTPLWRAIQHGFLPQVQRLLAARADPNIADDRGVSPLLLAVSQGQLRMCEILLTHGADPNHADKMGDTALHHATQIQIQRLVFNYNLNLMDTYLEIFYALLLTDNVDETIRNKDGDLALDVIEIPLAEVFDHVIKHRKILSGYKPKGSFTSILARNAKQLQTDFGLSQNDAEAFSKALQNYKAHVSSKSGGGPCTLINTKLTPYKRKFKHLYDSGKAVLKTEDDNTKEEGISKCPVMGHGKKTDQGGKCPFSGSNATLESPSVKCPVTGQSGAMPKEHSEYVKQLQQGNLSSINTQQIPSKCPFSANYKPGDDVGSPCAQQ